MRESLDDSTRAATPRARGHSTAKSTAADLAIASLEDGEFVVDLYAWLGVPRHASADEIRQAYYARAMALHPDRNPNGAASAETLKSITRGASILRDPRTRKLYDRGDIDALGHLTASGADRRRRANVTRTFGFYFLGPFATGLAVVVALLWTQAPVTAGTNLGALSHRQPVANVAPLSRLAFAASLPSEDPRAPNLAATAGDGASPRISAAKPSEPSRIAAPQPAPVAVAPSSTGTAKPARAVAASRASEPSDVADRDAATTEFEALAASAASNLAREIERVSGTRSASPGKGATGAKGDVVSALKPSREQTTDLPPTPVARKAARPTVLALNGKPNPAQREGHALSGRPAH